MFTWWIVLWFLRTHKQQQEQKNGFIGWDFFSNLALACASARTKDHQTGSPTLIQMDYAGDPKRAFLYEKIFTDKLRLFTNEWNKSICLPVSIHLCCTRVCGCVRACVRPSTFDAPTFELGSLFQGEPPDAPDPSSISIVLGKDAHLEDYIQILNPPMIISGDRTQVQVEYRCTDEKLVGVQVITDVTNIYTDVSVKIFQKIFRCHKSSDVKESKFRKVRLKIPAGLAFNNNAVNKNTSLTSRTKIRAWVLDQDWWPHCWKDKNCYSRSFVKVSYDTLIQTTFSRPYRKSEISRECVSWEWNVLSYSSSFYVPRCRKEHGL